MLKLLKHLKLREWGFIVICVAFISVQVWLDLKLPDFMSEITVLVQTPDSVAREIWLKGGYMVLCAFGSLIASVVTGFFAARVAASFSARLRRMVFDKVLSFSMQEISNFSTPSLITRTTNDITQTQMFIAMSLQVIVKAPILAVWAVIKIAGKNPGWTLATAGAVAFMIAMMSVIIVFAVPRFSQIQKLTDNLNRVTRENLTGLRVVRSFNAEKYQEEKFEKANGELNATQLFVHRVMAVMHPGMSLIMSGLSLSIYWIGAYIISAADVTGRLALFSDMVVFSAYSVQVIMAFMMMTVIFVMLPRASVSAKRISEVLDVEPAIVDGLLAHREQALDGEVEFRNVSFRYPGAEEYILKDISFTARKGETVAFIGSTGSGKSTLINLIPRFFDATDGEVLVDGVNVKDYTQEALRDRLGYVPQKAVMFSGTVKSNVAYGGEGSDKDIAGAVAVAQAAEFVEKMEGGYGAAISQGGANISGGQRQRLAIARAVCRKPEIFIFDDSFSALDYKTDRELRKMLKKETSGATSLIVAQRIGTIRDADKIIVLDEGRIVGTGTHGELLESCAVYREIAYSQLSREELNYA